MNIARREIIEVVGVAAVVLSLLFVGYELRLTRTIAMSEDRNSNSERQLYVRELISSNSDVWQKGCLGDSLTNAEKVVFGQLLQGYNNWMYVRWRNAGGGSSVGAGISQIPTVQLPLEVALNMYRFPGFRDGWREINEFQAAEHPIRQEVVGSSQINWKGEVELLYQRLVDSNEPVNSNPLLCGL